MENTKQNFTIVVAILISFIAGMGGGIVANQYGIGSALNLPNAETSPPQGTKNEQTTYIEESDSINAIKKVGPAVVSIVTTKDLKIYKDQPFSFFGPEDLDDSAFPEFFAPRRRVLPEGGQEGQDYEVKKTKVGGGSGFIISEDGMVLTNRHVVSDKGVEYTIITNDGTEYDGEVISIDPLNDLAVLQMIKQGERTKKKEERTKLSGLTVAEMGDSDSLQVGQKVLAIGYALGEYENTVTAGIISAKSRDITAADRGKAETLSGLLQTDAAINPGNSGGPLINLNGQVVGINVAIDNSGSSIGFAIPMNDIKSVLESIKKYGKIVRPVLGVRHKLLDRESAEELGLNVDHGALLVGNEAEGEFAVIPGSPADKAGLKIKDVILSVDGKDVTLEKGLTDIIAQYKPGDEITLKVWRSGETKEIKVKLEENKEN